MPVIDKTSPNQPDYRVISQGIEIGAGWIPTGQISGKEYVLLSISVPQLGTKTLYANLGRPAGQNRRSDATRTITPAPVRGRASFRGAA